MGYFTRYSLDWHKPIANGESEKHNEICDYLAAKEFYAIDSDGNTQDSCKWYEHDTDMKALSQIFPQILFTLHGEGEESGDIWNKYYLNGKVHKEVAEIVIAPFDKKKLKDIP